MSKKTKRVLGGGFLVLLGIFVGGMLDFYPFLGNDLIAREIQYSTFIICMTVILCTIDTKEK